MRNIFQKPNGFYYFNYKRVGLILISLVLLFAIGWVLSYEPTFQRECVSYSNGVWSNDCIVDTIYNRK